MAKTAKNVKPEPTLQELLEKKQAIQKALQVQLNKEAQELVKRLKFVAGELGKPVEELIAPNKPKAKPKAKKSKLKGKKLPILYRNPENKRDSWTGRGRKPKWVEAHIANGGKLEDLAV